MASPGAAAPVASAPEPQRNPAPPAPPSSATPRGRVLSTTESPMKTPTTRQVSEQVVGEVEASLGQTIPFFPKAFIRVLAWALAGVVVLLYKYAGFIFLQVFVQHASADETTINGKKVRPLIEWGRLLGVGDPQAAVRAEHLISVPVTNQTGSLKAGQVLFYAPTRLLYKVVADVPLNAPSVTVKIRAFGDEGGGDGSGAIGNLEPGAIVSFATPPANVGTDCTVTSTVVQGANAEATEAYRARIIRRVQARPQGGALADYEAWGLEVPGIVHVYPYAGEREGGSGNGQVDIYVQATPESSGDPDGIPTPEQLTAVFDSIQKIDPTSGKATRRPVGVAVNVFPISLFPVTVTVYALWPRGAAVEADIKDAAAEFLRLREPYIEGLSVLPREDGITQAGVGGVVMNAANAHGASVSEVSIDVPAGYRLRDGQKARLAATPTYIDPIS